MPNAQRNALLVIASWPVVMASLEKRFANR